MAKMRTVFGIVVASGAHTGALLPSVRWMDGGHCALGPGQTTAVVVMMMMAWRRSHVV